MANSFVSGVTCRSRLVSMKLLPKNQAGVGEKQSVRYELERKPLGEREVNLLVRLNRFPIKLK